MGAKSSDVTKLFLKTQTGSIFETPDVFIPISEGFSNNPNVESIARTVLTGTGSNLAPVTGQRFVAMSLPHEVTGVDYSASEVPFIDPVLQGVGMVGAFGEAIPGTVTVDIEIGDIIDGVISGASAICVVPAKIGDTFIYIDTVTSGPFQAESLEVSASAVGTATGAEEQQSREYTYVANADIKNLSVRLEEDLQKTEGFGGNLTMNLEAPASQIMTAQMELQAKFNQDGGEDVFRKGPIAMTDTSSFVDKQPPVFDCARFEIDGVNDLVAAGTFSLDFGANVQVRPNVNKCDGVESIFIPNREPTFSFRIEQPLNATWEYYQTWVGQATSPSYWRYGDTQYNTMHIIMPALKITAVASATENKIAYVDITCALTGVSDDDLKLLFT
jgi:hypothetical protein